jgi:hypothetical protein
VTIAYPYDSINFWDFLCGKITDIRVQVRVLPITEEMMGDYFEDENFRNAFQNWLNALWEQKDRCIRDLVSAELPDAQTSETPIPAFTEPFPVFKSLSEKNTSCVS